MRYMLPVHVLVQIDGVDVFSLDGQLLSVASNPYRNKYRVLSSCHGFIDSFIKIKYPYPKVWHKPSLEEIL